MTTTIIQEVAMFKPRRIAACALVLCAALAGVAAAARSQPPAQAGNARAVDPRFNFGLQYVPKFDEKKGRGAWNGTRGRGLAMRRELGTQVGREGLMWSKFQPEGPKLGPYMKDFDDSIDTLVAGDMACMAMVTETPAWATTATSFDPKKPETFRSAPPRGLDLPIFADGSDTPGPGKRANPDNTFAQALEAMLIRYKGKVRYWQVWNEPDYPNGVLTADETDKRRSWTGSVEGYVRLLQVAHTLVKLHQPRALVVTGGLGHAAYLDAIIARGGAPYFDMLDFHAYGWPGSDAALDAYQRVHDEMGRVLARHKLDRGMLCSETGYSSGEPFEQADYVAKVYPTALALGVESTMYYADVNPSWRNMGLIDWKTMSQKTAGYWAYKTAATALRDVKSVAPLERPGLRGYRFERAGKAPLYVAWVPKGGGGKPVEVPVGAGSWAIHDATGRSLGRQSGPTVKLVLGSSPRWIDGDLQRAYVAPRPNPALARPGLALAGCSADSSAEGHGGPEAAIDTDTDTQWLNGGNKVRNAWLQVELAHPSLVRRLRVKTGPTPKGTWFDVEASTDGREYRAIATHQRLSSWQMEDIALPAIAPTKFLRLSWHDPAGSGAHFSVFELEAHSDKSALNAVM
jgi:hypothetical protein